MNSSRQSTVPFGVNCMTPWRALQWVRLMRSRLGLGAGPAIAMVLVATLAGCSRAEDNPAAKGGSREPASAKKLAGITYWNDKKPEIPWSIHIVKLDRAQADLVFTSTLARNTVFGLSTLGSQIGSVPASVGKPVVGINGDFYVVDHGPYIGDPRGLQIMNGEVVSAPTDQVVFWIDATSQPHSAHVESKFTLTWPDGATSPLKLNEERSARESVLYTPRLGPSTRAVGGREVVVAREADSPWLPLTIATHYTLKVTEVRDTGDTSLKGDRMVLSFGAKVANAATLVVGSILKISTGTDPELSGVRFAIGGGNIMIRQGVVQDIQIPSGGAYKYRSVLERHPRSAVGFNRTHIFLVEVDGRQPDLSVGMTLHELGEYMRGLGCEEAMNFDGGGSSTLWVDGKVVNSPCNGSERDIGNGLVVVRKPTEQAAGGK